MPLLMIALGKRSFFKAFKERTTEYPANGSFDRAIRARSVSSRALEKNIYGQASRLISIGKLNASQRLHTRPIDLVIFQEPLGIL